MKNSVSDCSVTIKTLPPPVPAGRSWQALDHAPGGVEVALPQCKARFINWRQVKLLHGGLTTALIEAQRNALRREIPA